MKSLFLSLLSLILAAQFSAAKIENVLLIISDDLKASTLGCYGDPLVKTPNVDALAAQGMVFNRAYCQGMTCGPSRMSFMFSRYREDKGTSMGQNFINHGFYSARVGKIFHMKVPGDIIEGANGPDYAECWTERFNSPGLEAHTFGKYSLFNHNIFTYSMKDRASTAEKDRWFVSVEYDGDGSDQPDWKTATKTIELLQKHKDKPFFIAAGFVRPHYPNVAPKQYFDKYPYTDVDLPYVPDGDLDDIPPEGYTDVISGKDPIGLYPDNQKRMWAAYYATITYMDEQMGRIIAEVDRLGLRETTAIVFMSDHGYHLGEHTFWQKNNLHEDVTRVPLIISAPGYKTGVSDAFVELVDMYPTVTELSGTPIPDTVQGKSLVPILKNPKAKVRDEAFSLGNSGGYALRSDEWTYIWYRDGVEELYDMKKDPKQYTNLAKDPKHAQVMDQYRGKLDAKLESEKLQRKPIRG
jgi:iduronate 2-sulfatase